MDSSTVGSTGLVLFLCLSVECKLKLCLTLLRERERERERWKDGFVECANEAGEAPPSSLSHF